MNILIRTYSIIVIKMKNEKEYEYSSSQLIYKNYYTKVKLETTKTVNGTLNES